MVTVEEARDAFIAILPSIVGVQCEPSEWFIVVLVSW
jgi:hypothetical protein